MTEQNEEIVKLLREISLKLDKVIANTKETAENLGDSLNILFSMFLAFRHTS
jgi:hypothetical protein